MLVPRKSALLRTSRPSSSKYELCRDRSSTGNSRPATYSRDNEKEFFSDIGGTTHETIPVGKRQNIPAHVITHLGIIIGYIRTLWPVSTKFHRASVRLGSFGGTPTEIIKELWIECITDKRSPKAVHLTTVLKVYELKRHV